MDKKKKSLKYSIIDGSFNSLMLGFGETFLRPFAIALKATNSQIGFLTSIPTLIGALTQLISANLVDKIRKRKTLVIGAVFLQALIWLPMFLLPLIFKENQVNYLLFFVVLYAAFGNFASPVWASWMGDLINEKERGRFFGFRQRIVGFMLFVAVFLGGYFLDLFSKFNLMLAFSILFAIAMISRFISCYYLAKMHEPRYVSETKEQFNLMQFIREMRKTNYGLFVIYTSFMNLAVYIAAPFFAVYMLRNLGFSYLSYTFVIVASSISSFLAMTYWGRLSDKFGNKKIITITGFLIPFVPLIWALVTKTYQIIILEVFSGFVWAGFNLSTSNFIFDNTQKQKRAKGFAYFNLFNSIAVFIGTSLGAFIATNLDALLLVSSLPIVFIISGLSRFLVSMIFLNKIKEVREVKKISTKKLMILTVTKPIREIIHEPIYFIEIGITKIIEGMKLVEIPKLMKKIDKTIKTKKIVDDIIKGKR